MRTKTLALSAVLGMLGAAAALGQNVYSLNTVGFINVTLYPGYNLVTCPLICSPDNTIATLFNNSAGAYQSYTVSRGHTSTNSAEVLGQINGVGLVTADFANSGYPVAGWEFGGTNTLNPGQALWFNNPAATNMLATFVGVVPQANIAVAANFPNGMTNTLASGYNMVGSMIPMSGNLVTGAVANINVSSALGTLSLGPTGNDLIAVYDPIKQSYDAGTNEGVFSAGARGRAGSWSIQPSTSYPFQGFWYYNANASANNWIETYVVNP
jgi:hypothetical protein